MSRCVLPVFLSALISVGSIPIAFAASNEPQLNFKIYSPEPAPSAATPEASTTETTPPSSNESIIPAIDAGASTMTPSTTTEAEPAAATNTTTEAPATPEIKTIETPAAVETPAAAPLAAETPTAAPATETPAAAPMAAETPVAAPVAETPVAAPVAESANLRGETPTEAKPTKAAEAEMDTPAAAPTAASTDATAGSETAAADTTTTEKTASNSKTLQGYVRVVPVGTKIPIIMDTAVDSETSQEGDEFTARTAEDLSIDGGVAVPAGSIIKGRIAQMNAPKHVDRSGSVALKFDTVTTPDNRQIPLVANLVARGGVVHAKRGLKDIAIDSGTIALPLLIGLGIGALAGNSNSSSSSSSTSSTGSKITKPEAAMIGAGIGLVVGVAILIAKKGKKVDVRPGDELKIELAEDLRMPMM